MVLKGYSYVGASLYRLHKPNAFDGRVGFDVDVSFIFPQIVLAAITLVVCGTGDGGARAGTRCGGETSSVPIVHHCSVRSPCGQARTGFVPFKCILNSPHTEIFAPSGQRSEEASAEDLLKQVRPMNRQKSDTLAV